jgi:hypothetical protein
LPKNLETLKLIGFNNSTYARYDLNKILISSRARIVSILSFIRIDRKEEQTQEHLKD